MYSRRARRSIVARMLSPSDQRVDIPIENGFVGMVDRDQFDEWLRERARLAGAERRCGVFERLERDTDGTAIVAYQPREGRHGAESPAVGVRARRVVGADGARSEVARQAIPGA